MIILGIILVLIAYFAIKYNSKRQNYNHMIRSFACPPRHPIFGTLQHFPSSSSGIFEVVQKFFPKYGKNYILTKPIYDVSLVISDPKYIEAILSNPNTKKAKKSQPYELIEPWLGTGLLTGYGEKWFTRRKIITPSFHFSILEGFIEVMSQQSDILVNKLKKHVGSTDFDISEPVNLFALDVICETSMGVTVKAQSSPNSEYVAAVKDMSRALQVRFFSVLGKIPFIYDLTSNGQKLKALLNVLHGFTTKVILERKNQLLNNNTQSGRMNFMDILLHAKINGKPLSNDDIREEVDTFMFEGHDTTASGIAFTMYLLSQNPDIQDKVYSELTQVFGTDPNNIDISLKKLNELPYLDMVVKESLRVYPPVGAIGRQLLEDTIIDGVRVPAGTNLSLSIYRMHHDSDNFPDPEKFDPERFNLLNDRKTKSFTYIPFSAGGRNCIGQKFAMLDLKTCLTKLILNFQLLPSSKVPVLQSDLILKSSNGVYVQLAERIRN